MVSASTLALIDQIGRKKGLSHRQRRAIQVGAEQGRLPHALPARVSAPASKEVCPYAPPPRKSGYRRRTEEEIKQATNNYEVQEFIPTHSVNMTAAKVAYQDQLDSRAMAEIHFAGRNSKKGSQEQVPTSRVGPETEISIVLDGIKERLDFLSEMKAMRRGDIRELDAVRAELSSLVRRIRHVDTSECLSLRRQVKAVLSGPTGNPKR
ncbi:uncharacterised protein family UPF0193 [Kipferlia bialata]|uniref:Uncharacterized protein n=1 Tax=Kipferlia bialata TaxID=797122 RepID=A0A9K3CQL1_9EUKA|nr:uncharacterised protein family UPF0193 [Kipferlia bialata]|eukprot:g2325.t1